jgi:hypothetical protein
MSVFAEADRALRARFQDHVEGSLGRAPNATEASVRDHRTEFSSPACAPSAAPTSCEREVGTQIIVEPA